MNTRDNVIQWRSSTYLDNHLLNVECILVVLIIQICHRVDGFTNAHSFKSRRYLLYSPIRISFAI